MMARLLLVIAVLLPLAACFCWRQRNPEALEPRRITWTASVTVSGKRRGGYVVKRNRHTVWFQLYDGRTIKRHIRKHFVVETAW